PPPFMPLFPYTTLFRSVQDPEVLAVGIGTDAAGDTNLATFELVPVVVDLVRIVGDLRVQQHPAGGRERHRARAHRSSESKPPSQDRKSVVWERGELSET